MKKGWKRALIALLCLVMMLALVPGKTQAAVGTGDWSNGWGWWDQKQSTVFGMRRWGCLVVAQAKLLCYAGIVSDSSFNPDIYYNWLVGSDLILSDMRMRRPFSGPTYYAQAYGKTLSYTQESEISDAKIWANINAGKYTILGMTSPYQHWVLVNNEASKELGKIRIFQSWGVDDNDNEYGSNPGTRDWTNTTVEVWTYTLSTTTPTPTTYTVSYDANGGTGAPGQQTKTQGQALTLSSNKPSRASTNPGGYTVTLDPNGGQVDTTSLTASRTTKYTFRNWNTAKDGSGTSYAPGASYTADANATLYAQWSSSTSTASVTLPTPWRYGYTFQGWAESSSAASGVTGSYKPSKSLTLYAAWAKEDLSGWSTTKPDNIYEDQIETATQYRYADRTVSGGWTLTGSGTIDYVQSWPSGFDTSNSLYSQYNKTPKTPGVSGNTKVEASTSANGWIYWHWTWVKGYLSGGSYNVFVKPMYCTEDGRCYQYFMAHWSDWDPNDPHHDRDGNYGGECFYYWRDDPSDGSWWWWRIPVYRQTYKEYTGANSSESWSDWSDWTMVKYSATENRKVETRTVYRYKSSVKPITVTFDPNGGSCATANKSVTRGETYGSLPTAKRNGFVFAGWYTAKEGGDLVSAATRVTATGAHTLYAHWTNAHTHTAGQPVKENEVAATCVKEGGYDEVTYCTGCGAELNRVHKTVPKLGHNPGQPVKENKVQPSCTADGGFDEVCYCANCHTELSRVHTTVPKLGHNPGQPVKENEVPATTETEGSYDEVTYCTRCGAELSRVHKTTGKLPPAHVTFKTQPKSVTKKSGSKVTFKVKVKEKHVTYQWYGRAPGAQEWTKMPGGTKASFKLVVSKAYDGWQFRCGVTNDGEAFSNTVTLTVKPQPPKFSSQPKDIKAKVGAKVKFRAKASGKNVLYQWYYRTSETGEWILIDGATKDKYEFKATADRFGWQFYCRAWNADGEIYSKVATLRQK